MLRTAAGSASDVGILIARLVTRVISLHECSSPRKPSAGLNGGARQHTPANSTRNQTMSKYITDTHEPLNPLSNAGGLQGVRVAWGGVWGGYLFATGVFLLLTTFGLAIGVSAADIGQDAEPGGSGLGIGAAIWSGLTLLVALFIGGMVATRTGMVHDRAAGMVEGALVWVLSILTIIYMAGSGIGMLAGSVSGVLGGLTQSAAAAVRNVDVTELSSGDVNQILARLNDPKTAQLAASATGMSPEEARLMLSNIRIRVESARNDPARAAAEARNGLQELASRAGARMERAAATAQPYASATVWTTFGAMVLGLLAAVGGAMLGRGQVRRRLENAAGESYRTASAARAG
jgi:hypothetical protein